MNKERITFGITYDDRNNEVYVFGGEDNFNVINRSEKYSVKKDEWTDIKSMPTLR